MLPEGQKVTSLAPWLITSSALVHHMIFEITLLTEGLNNQLTDLSLMPFKIDYLQSALHNWQHVENQEREGTPTPLLHKTSGNCRSN